MIFNNKRIILLVEFFFILSIMLLKFMYLAATTRNVC
jgi:hypothetical protein